MKDRTMSTTTGTYDEIVNALNQVATCSGYVDSDRSPRIASMSTVYIEQDSLMTGNHPPVTANTPVFILTVEQLQASGLLPGRPSGE